MDRLTDDQFADLVQSAVDSLPRDLRDRIDNVAIVIEMSHPHDPGIFGEYSGTPLTSRGSDTAGGLPDRISIYREPLEIEFGSDPERLRSEIRITVLHELAHYFGIDEDRLDELGYA